MSPTVPRTQGGAFHWLLAVGLGSSWEASAARAVRPISATADSGAFLAEGHVQQLTRSFRGRLVPGEEAETAVAPEGLTPTGGGGQCPMGGAMSAHSCWMTVSFFNVTCSEVSTEAQARMQATSRWEDPFVQWQDPEAEPGLHNITSGLRQGSMDGMWYTDTAGGYTDILRVSFASGNNSCVLFACAESNQTSPYGEVTNYCNLRNLYCGSEEGCGSVHSDFSGLFTEEYNNCIPVADECSGTTTTTTTTSTTTAQTVTPTAAQTVTTTAAQTVTTTAIM